MGKVWMAVPSPDTEWRGMTDVTELSPSVYLNPVLCRCRCCCRRRRRCKFASAADIPASSSDWSCLLTISMCVSLTYLLTCQ